MGYKPQVMYRLYNLSGRLLYIGITTKLSVRLSGHRAEQPWWPEVASWTEERYFSRSQVEKAEAAAIVAEDPLYNKAGRPIQGPLPKGKIRYRR